MSRRNRNTRSPYTKTNHQRPATRPQDDILVGARPCWSNRQEIVKIKVEDLASDPEFSSDRWMTPERDEEWKLWVDATGKSLLFAQRLTPNPLDQARALITAGLVVLRNVSGNPTEMVDDAMRCAELVNAPPPSKEVRAAEQR